MNPKPIVIVSGLPRSGTSLMMQMLDRGGMAVVTDNIRSADTDNPKGYYEFEKVKTIKRDQSWVPTLQGKAVKMVSQLLYDLPTGQDYRILFMERDLDEMLLSQEKMLGRLGNNPAPSDTLKSAFSQHLERLHAWLSRQPSMAVLRIGYRALLECARPEAVRIQDFLGVSLDIDLMVQTVDPALYRNRKGTEKTTEVGST